MADLSLFRVTNMADMTSRGNTLFMKKSLLKWKFTKRLPTPLCFLFFNSFLGVWKWIEVLLLLFDDVMPLNCYCFQIIFVTSLWSFRFVSKCSVWNFRLHLVFWCDNNHLSSWRAKFTFVNVFLTLEVYLLVKLYFLFFGYFIGCCPLLGEVIKTSKVREHKQVCTIAVYT